MDCQFVLFATMGGEINTLGCFQMNPENLVKFVNELTNNDKPFDYFVFNMVWVYQRYKMHWLWRHRETAECLSGVRI